jgi:hypothetical protein
VRYRAPHRGPTEPRVRSPRHPADGRRAGAGGRLARADRAHTRASSRPLRHFSGNRITDDPRILRASPPRDRMVTPTCTVTVPRPAPGRRPTRQSCPPTLVLIRDPVNDPDRRRPNRHELVRASGTTAACARSGSRDDRASQRDSRHRTAFCVSRRGVGTASRCASKALIAKRITSTHSREVGRRLAEDQERSYRRRPDRWLEPRRRPPHRNHRLPAGRSVHTGRNGHPQRRHGFHRRDPPRPHRSPSEAGDPELTGQVDPAASVVGACGAFNDLDCTVPRGQRTSCGQACDPGTNDEVRNTVTRACALHRRKGTASMPGRSDRRARCWRCGGTRCPGRISP